MSQEQAKAALGKMNTDKAFSAKVLAGADMAARLKIINAAGFDCTAEEIKAVSKQLGDDELDKVAGGCGFMCSVLWI